MKWTFRPVAKWAEATSEWDRVNDDAGRLPFLESTFLSPLLLEFERGDETVAIATRGDRPVAAALLRPAGLARIETVQPSQLPLGAWLVASGEDSGSAASSLLSQWPGLLLGLGLTQIDPRLQPRLASTPSIDTLDYIETGWVDVVGSFEDYWNSRGKNLRTNMRKQRSKLEADGVVLGFDVVTSAALVADAMIEYGRLETAGWKAGMGTAVHPENAQGRFYRNMLCNFCELGRGSIWRLKFGDKVVAMDLCIEAGDTLVILKTAFDPEFRSVSPAFLMRQEAFHRVFDEGRIRRIEFYGRLMEWHTRWTEQSRMLYHANVFRWAAVPRLKRLWQRLAWRRAPASAGGEGAASADSQRLPGAE